MIVTAWPVPPSVEMCERIVDTWAAFHGFWWRHPRLGRDVGTFLDDQALAAIAVERHQRYARFAELLGDRLGRGARSLYTRLLDALDRLITPGLLYENCTLVHGDAHVWNLLYPRDGHRRQRPPHRLGELAPGARRQRHRLHDGRALVSGASSAPRGLPPRPLPRRAVCRRRQGL